MTVEFDFDIYEYQLIQIFEGNTTLTDVIDGYLGHINPTESMTFKIEEREFNAFGYTGIGFLTTHGNWFIERTKILMDMDWEFAKKLIESEKSDDNIEIGLLQITGTKDTGKLRQFYDSLMKRFKKGD